MSWLELGWKVLVVRGAIGIVVGVVAMVWPDITVLALVVLWGFWALFDGIGSGVAAFRVEGAGPRTMYAVIGLVSLVAAFFAIFRPIETAVALTWILGIWLIVRGVMEVLGAFSRDAEGPRWLHLLGAALSIAAGVLFVANRGVAAVAVVFWLGLVALLWGIAFVAAGLYARRVTHEGRAEPAPAT